MPPSPRPLDTEPNALSPSSHPVSTEQVPTLCWPAAGAPSTEQLRYSPCPATAKECQGSRYRTLIVIKEKYIVPRDSAKASLRFYY